MTSAPAQHDLCSMVHAAIFIEHANTRDQARPEVKDCPMLHLLIRFGLELSFALIALGITALVWNLARQAGKLDGREKRGRGRPAQPPTQGLDAHARIELRGPGSRWQ
jgi:hypothetical protein